MNHSKSSRWSQWVQSPIGKMSLILLSVIAFYLITAHTVHVVGALPYLLPFACIFMHLFMMHGGHGGHSGHNQP